MPPASGPVTGRTATVIAASGLNLRAGPSQSAQVLATLGYGVSVTVTGDSVSGFYPVRVGTLSGYASADYLRFGDAAAILSDAAQTVTAQEQPASGAQTATQPQTDVQSPQDAAASQEETASHQVQTDSAYRVVVESENGLRLRAAPDTSSDVVYILPYGMVLEVLSEEENGFLYVRWGNYRGYVSGQFVTPFGNQ